MDTIDTRDHMYGEEMTAPVTGHRVLLRFPGRATTKSTSPLPLPPVINSIQDPPDPSDPSFYILHYMSRGRIEYEVLSALANHFLNCFQEAVTQVDGDMLKVFE